MMDSEILGGPAGDSLDKWEGSKGILLKETKSVHSALVSPQYKVKV